MNLKQLFVFGSPKATCKNCRKAEAIIEEVIMGNEDLFDYRKLTLDSQEAQDLGVLCTPSVTLNGQIIVLGELPDREALENVLLSS